MRRPVLRTLFLVGTIIAGQPHTAAAQSPEARMSAIERQIEALQGELRRVRRDLASRDGQVRSAQAETARARQDLQVAQNRAGRPSGGTRPVQAAPGSRPDAAGSEAPGGGSPSGPGAAPPNGQEAVQNPTEQSQSGQAGSRLGSFQVGGVTVKLGGFVELAGIYRTRNEVADIASNFTTGIPFSNNPLAHEGEFRLTARQSRLSLQVQGDIDPVRRLTAYVEADFQGGAPTANSLESNSFNPRLRQAYGVYDNRTAGFHVLAGQAWSLLTMNRQGIVPQLEDIPLTIDAQYVPGFIWTRQPQLRITQELLDHKLSLAASLENPQTNYYVGPNGTGVGQGSANTVNPGIGILATGGNFSTEIGPDLILKAAYDPGFGHYEVYGLGRFLHDRVSVVGDGRNNTVFAGGVGGGLIVPLVPKKLDIEARGLVGYGIGRYGTSQLPDATIGRDGAPKPLAEAILLVGLVGHPAPSVDLYAYAGTEQERKKAFTAAGKGYGYGSPLYPNAGCGVELSMQTCTGNTAGVVQGTFGAWWRFLQGNYGTAEVGGQYAYTRRSTFGGVGGRPSADEHTALISFRYLPFQ